MFQEFRIAVERVLDEHDRAVKLAWNIALFERQQKLPDLQSVLARRGQPAGQTVSQQRAALETLSGQYGIPLRKAKSTPMEARG